MFKELFFNSSLFLITSFSLFASEQVQVLANHLHFEDETFSTNSGALIVGDNIRIQAKNVHYKRALKSEKKEHSIVAEEDLMIVYNGRIFLADKLEYNFLTREGFMTRGLTYDNLWFISGDKIELNSDKSITIQNAMITTSEKPKAEFALHAAILKLKSKSSLSAKHLKVSFLNVPIFYMPFFYSSLNEKDHSKLKYKVTWDSGQGPKLSMRYQIYSSKVSDLFLRFDFRLNRGIAGAIETDYTSENQLIDFKTKNYLAHDTFFNDSNPNRKITRYRLQGIMHAQDDADTFLALMRYDKYSDPNMPLDFDADDFELNTALKTELIIQKLHPLIATNFILTPKINSFQGFKQEIPTLRLGFKPLNLGKTGLIFENNLNFSYLNYQYNQSLEIPIPSFHSGRLEAYENIYWPIDLKYLVITPALSYNGIYYTNSPDHQDPFENLFTYSLQMSTSLKKTTENFSHLINPYVKYSKIQPIHLKPHYIFSYDDGYDPYQFVKIGVKNHFFILNEKIDLDLFAFHFIDQNNFKTSFPKIGLDLDYDQDRFYFNSNCIFNAENHVFDQANFEFKWTVNQYVAFKTGIRHRGRFGYRKVNFEDFTLDVNQNTETLLRSPISNPRNAANFAIQCNATKSTQLRYESNIGWNKKDQPFYHEFRLDLFKMIATNWKLRVSYMHLVNDDQVAFGLTLVPNL